MKMCINAVIANTEGAKQSVMFKRLLRRYDKKNYASRNDIELLVTK